MGKRTLDDAMDKIFEHWAIGSEAKKNLELYEPSDKEEDGNTPEAPADQESRGSKTDPQRVENRPSKIDPQRVENKPSGTSLQKRTFKTRPTGDLDNATFTLIDNIPKRHFFHYFNALYDVVLPSLNPKDRLPRLILCVLFRRAHGFNRNFCQVSFRELERVTGAGRNTIRNNIKPLIEDGWVCIIADGYREATTYGLRIPVDFPEDLEEGELPPEPVQNPEQETSVYTETEGRKQRVEIRPSKTDPLKQTLRGSKTEGLKLTTCTGSTCTEQSTGQIPDSHPWYDSQNNVRTDSTLEPIGKNQVIGNLAVKNSLETKPSTMNRPGSYITPLEESYLKSLPQKKVGEIYRAQDAWDEILGSDTRPSVAKLNQMLQYMRGWYRGDTLDTKFRWCLSDTKKKRPRDAVAWLISALKHGRYPNIVMSKSRGEGIGSSSLESRPSKTSSVNSLGKATDEQSRLDRPEHTREATAEREKRRAASPHRDVWEKVLKDIGEKILPQSYESWFKPLFIAEITDTAIVFDAPDQMVADWVEMNYTGLLKTTLKTAGIFDRSIAIETHLRS